MKSIGFQDIAGGMIHTYKNHKKPAQKRWDRFFEALEDLQHTGNIIIYRVNKKGVKRLSIRRY